MKIGLLTFHDTNNFGSYLQTYGLYRKVIDLGYNCEIIDYQCEAIRKREKIERYKLSFNVKEIIKEILFRRILRNKYINLRCWLLNNTQVSQSYLKNTISSASLQYDRFLVGSDIVWGMDIIENDTTYFLDFENDPKKKISFASSIGNPWSEDEKNIVRPLINDFSFLSVRENESAEWIEELTHRRPKVVCDPTMLLTAKEWTLLMSEKYAKENYVLVYFPTKENLNDAKDFAEKHNLNCLVINYYLPIKGFKSVKPTTIADFLSLFYYASFVFTASYHGMLFSIYFNREFAYYNRSHKSRMNSLARKLCVHDREAALYDVNNMKSIDYNKVNAAVDAYRIYSIQVLKEILKK